MNCGLPPADKIYFAGSDLGQLNACNDFIDFVSGETIVQGDDGSGYQQD